MNFIQLNTGLIFKTTETITYYKDGNMISIPGKIYIPGQSTKDDDEDGYRKVDNFTCHTSTIIASWKE